MTLGFQDGHFEAGDGLAGDSEHTEDFIPKRLFVGAFAGVVPGFPGEADGAVDGIAI
ncbi:MAG: hypothetical protein IH623_29460 [Verrucomicrobia bacterium]|nr:hypothetical protein [Verrucomicrobiota bacterium]